MVAENPEHPPEPALDLLRVTLREERELAVRTDAERQVRVTRERGRELHAATLEGFDGAGGAEDGGAGWSEVGSGSRRSATSRASSSRNQPRVTRGATEPVIRPPR